MVNPRPPCTDSVCTVCMDWKGAAVGGCCWPAALQHLPRVSFFLFHHIKRLSRLKCNIYHKKDCGATSENGISFFTYDISIERWVWKISPIFRWSPIMGWSVSTERARSSPYEHTHAYSCIAGEGTHGHPQREVRVQTQLYITSLSPFLSPTHPHTRIHTHG